MRTDTAVTAEPLPVAHPSGTPASQVTTLTGASAGQSQLRRNLKRFLIGNKLNLVGLVKIGRASCRERV